MIYLYTILFIIFLTLFPFLGSQLSLTWGDFLAIPFLLFFLNDLLKNKIIGNIFSRKSILYLSVLLITSAINFTFLEGKFLNIFKTGIISLILYLVIYNLFKKQQLQTNSFVLGVALLSVLFLSKTWTEMQETWGEVEFTNVNIFDSSLNLNTWGFVLVLFLQIALYVWCKKVYPKWNFVAIILISVFIFFSFSRTAYYLSLISIGYTVFYVQKFKLKKIIFPVILTLFIFSFNEYFNFFNFKLSTLSLEFFNNKSSKTGSDLIETRFLLINIKPILENFSNFNIIQVLLGDGISVQHSFVSHTLIVTGIYGFVVYMQRYTAMIKSAIQHIKTKSNTLEAQFVFLFLIVILTNDFITNLSHFLPFSAYLSAIILAFLLAQMEIPQSKK